MCRESMAEASQIIILIENASHEEALMRLRNADLRDMKIVWLPNSILLADGSSLGESDSV